MKRYEKMSKEEIVELVVKVGKVFCDQCPIKGDCERLDRDNCSSKLALYLQEKVITKPRFVTFKSAEELMNAYIEHEKKYCYNMCCDDCKYNHADSRSCVLHWFCEEIETEV